VTEREGNRVMFTFGDPNYAGLYWVMSIFLVYATARPRRRGVRILAYALLLTALALSESNGGVVALGVGLAAIFVMRQTRRRGTMGGIAAGLAVLSLAGALTLFLPFSAVQTWARDSNQPLLVNSIGRSDSSSEQRSELIHESVQLYTSDGWQGSGPASTKALLTDRGYSYAKEAHDDYLAALTERGPIGLLGLVVIIVAAAARASVVARRAVRADKVDDDDPNPLPRPAGLLAALLAAAVAGGYYEVLHFRFVWAALALVAAFAGSAIRDKKTAGQLS
jgi:O-antigen ligase